jgi:tetratricopeptide (TPR) repeat protein
MSTPSPRPLPPPPQRRVYVPVIGPGLKKVLVGVLGLFALLSVNSLYLGSITLLEWATGQLFQTPFYFFMHFAHVALGVLLAVPAIVFTLLHWKAAHDRPNRRAVRAGIGLALAVLLTLVSGVLLVRFQGFTPLKDPALLKVAYWAHVGGPILIVWLFVLHRLAGKKIRWKVGLAWAAVAAVFAGVMVLLHARDPRGAGVGPKDGAQYFFPSLALTATGKFIPAEAMQNDQYCLQCHADVHQAWSHSAHRFSSFSNDAYLFSVRNTRRKLKERDGHLRNSRWCAGCHDPIPFFSGAFEQSKWDDPEYDLASDPMASAGITCTVCHSITAVNSTKGNAAFTLEEAQHYPFATSENPILQWINRQMILSKPEFHKRTFLKPFHKTAEFCSTCHKVHLPPELNDYKWLRGQNHYDPFIQSGPGGHGITSFYYPPKSEPNCNTCHMPLYASEDFGAKDFDASGTRKVHDHQFPAANTAIPFLEKMPAWVNEKHAKFNEGVMRVDIFGVREGGTIDGALTAPLRPKLPVLQPGATYLVDTVVRAVKMGHLFTQGTADSNEVWLDVKVTQAGRVVGRSGGMGDGREVDPWSHFVNAFVIDREGKRIDRRNPEDIFLPLYNHQIGPGSADVIHYRLKVPEGSTAPLEVEVMLRYRKFDTTYMKLFQGPAFTTNDLPILTLARDRIVLPVAGGEAAPAQAESAIPTWQRWNDYGIGSLMKGSDTGPHKGELKQAEDAFLEVEKLGRGDGSLNRARVYLREGRLDEAAAALAKAAQATPPPPPWSLAWHGGLVSQQNGDLDRAVEAFRTVATMDTEETRKRGFDFSKDFRVLNELARALFERAKQERGGAHAAARTAMLREAAGWHERALLLDSENVDAHYGLSLLYEELGDAKKAEHHRSEHARYKLDDNAADRAVAAAKARYPAADRASEVVVIYDLTREGAYELSR